MLSLIHPIVLFLCYATLFLDGPLWFGRGQAAKEETGNADPEDQAIGLSKEARGQKAADPQDGSQRYQQGNGRQDVENDHTS